MNYKIHTSDIELLRTYPQYGKNEQTLNRYLNYHNEIQILMAHAKGNSSR